MAPIKFTKYCRGEVRQRGNECSRFFARNNRDLERTYSTREHFRKLSTILKHLEPLLVDQQMNQAGSENKCSKRVSNECILNNYNFDDVSTDQNSICENCKQRGWSVCSKHSFHVGSVSNTGHVLEVAVVSQQQQTGTNNSCHQSVLQKAWVYLQSVIITHMSGCPKCNPKLPPSSSVESLSQNSLSSTSSPSRSPSKLSCLSCMTSCQRSRSPSQARPSSPKATSPCCNARPSCQRAVSPCPRHTPPCPNIRAPCANAKRTSSDAKPTCHHNKPFCLNAKCPNPSCTNVKPSCENLQAPCPYALPPCPNAKSPSAEPSCPSLQPPCPHAEPPGPNGKAPCAHVKSPCANAKRTSSDAKPTCHHIKPFCLNAKCPNPFCTNVKPSCENLQGPCPYALPPCPNAKYPSAEPSCPSLQPPCPQAEPPGPNGKAPCANVKSPCANAKRTSSDAKPTCHHIKPFCLNAKCPNPSCTNVKPSCEILQGPCPYALPPCPNAKNPRAEPSCPSLQPPCPHAEPPCPNAKPPCPNAKCSNAKPSYSCFQPPCPHAKPSRLNNKCPNAKPSCPSLQKLKNSKTSLYHSFSDDSISSICKESMVELTKIYIQKMTSNHKIRCKRCSKQHTFANSKETMTSYLRSIFDQAWSYLNMSSEENTCQPQCVQSNNLNTCSDPRMSESPSPTKLPCCCAGSQPNPAKTQPYEAVCFPKTVCSTKSVTVPDPGTCTTCLTPATCTKPVPYPRPVSCPICNKPTCAKLATCPMFYKCEGTTSPAQSSKEEGTHEHKSCDTPCCVHKSQGVQPSYIMTDKSCWSSQPPLKPLFKRSHQIKTPQSVEELKASITGMTCLDKSSGNMLGCEIMDFRSTIIYPKPCVQDLKVSKDSICSTDIPPPKLGSLSMEKKDHAFGTQPKECRHSKEFHDNCEDTVSTCNDLKEQTCKEDVICPSSGSHVKSDEVLLDKDFGKPREQVHNKENICKSGRNSVTCVDSNHPDLKDCNATEIDAHRKDPYNYRYYY